MEITKESLTEIRNVIKLYKEKEFNLDIYYSIIEVLRSDKLFDNPILLGKSETGPAFIRPAEGRLYFCEAIYEYCKEYVKNYSSLIGLSEIEAYNYKFIFTLFHELAHLKQADYAYYEKSIHDIINKLYKLIYIEGKENEEHYIENPYEYSFEVAADLEAMDTLIHLFDDKKIKLINNIDYISHVGERYYDFESGKVEFLAQKTCRLMCVEDESVKQIHKIPLKVAVHNGLPISQKMLEYLFGKLDDELAVLNILRIRQKINSKKYNKVRR